MNSTRTERAIHAARRRLEREAQRRFRDLERQGKEQAKMSAQEQARLEVETYENELELLLSVHKEPCEKWDWIGLAGAPRLNRPERHSYHELRARQNLTLDHSIAHDSAKEPLEQARRLDDGDYKEAIASYSHEMDELEKVRDLALRILKGDHMAFIEAFATFNPVAEISNAGSLKRFAVESNKLIDCAFKVSGNEVIPSVVKTLTATGKVSTKPMPRTRFNEIYHDYVCGCVFRMASEIFAMLPIDNLLITVLADVMDPPSGQNLELPVLSVELPRERAAGLNFDLVTAGDAISKFFHRGNFVASRKLGAFAPIVPLSPSDLHEALLGQGGIENHLLAVQKERDNVKAMQVRIDRAEHAFSA